MFTGNDANKYYQKEQTYAKILDGATLSTGEHCKFCI